MFHVEKESSSLLWSSTIIFCLLFISSFASRISFVFFFFVLQKGEETRKITRRRCWIIFNEREANWNSSHNSRESQIWFLAQHRNAHLNQSRVNRRHRGWATREWVKFGFCGFLLVFFVWKIISNFSLHCFVHSVGFFFAYLVCLGIESLKKRSNDDAIAKHIFHCLHFWRLNHIFSLGC